jgi:hypothetical protein
MPRPGPIPPDHRRDRGVITMDRVRVNKIMRYITTDGKEFIGKDAKRGALAHQKELDVKDKVMSKQEELVKYIHKAFGIGPEPIEDDYKDGDEEDYDVAYDSYLADCEEVLDPIEGIDDLEDMKGFANTLSSIFYHIGRERWDGVAKILEG